MSATDERVAKVQADLEALHKRVAERVEWRDAQDNTYSAALARLAETTRLLEARNGDLERRLGAAEDVLSTPPPETDWPKIGGLIVTCAGLVWALNQYVATNIERRVEADERVIVRLGDKVDKLQTDQAASAITQQRNTELIRGMESRLGQAQVDIARLDTEIKMRHNGETSN
jgi:hypothetical protein